MKISLFSLSLSLSLSLVCLVAVTMRSIDPAECFSRAQENLVSKEEEEYTKKLVGGKRRRE
jgi:hypothetical protein